MPVTNKGKAHFLAKARGVAAPTNYYLAFCTVTNTPDADTNTLGELTEIAAGNGYATGGVQLTPGTTDFDVLNEDDANDKAELQIKDIIVTASGGSIPSSGDGIYWVVLTDDNGTVANREVYAAWSLSSARSVTDGNSLTIYNLEIEAL